MSFPFGGGGGGGGGGGENLAATLALGNTTGANDIVQTAGTQFLAATNAGGGADDPEYSFAADPTTGHQIEGAGVWDFYVSDVLVMVLTATLFLISQVLRIGDTLGGTINEKLTVSGTTGDNLMSVRFNGNVTNGPSINFDKGRGSPLVQTSYQDDDTIGTLGFQGFITGGGGDSLTPLATIACEADGVPAVGDSPGRIIISTTPSGSDTPVAAQTILEDQVTQFAAPLQFQTFTVAALPAVTTDRMIVVSDETGGLVPAFSDGTNWRRVTDRAIVA